MNDTLPLFEYPTTLVCVDDDKLLLETLSRFMQGKQRVRTFSEPDEASDFFNTYVPPSQKFTFLHSDKHNDFYGCLAHAPVDFDVTTLSHIKDYAPRVEEVAVAIIDLNMPSIDGIALCRQLTESPIKKILLTGEASYEQAVKAFNEGIIDRFLRKDNGDIAEQLTNQIQSLTRDYFVERTMNVREHLEIDHPLALTDSIFADYFMTWQQQLAIKEFYLIDQQGSMLGLDQHANQHILAVHTDRSLASFIEINSDADDAGNYVQDVQDVQDRKKIPFFGFKKESWHIDPSQWHGLFYTPEVLQGRETYYIATLNNIFVDDAREIDYNGRSENISVM